MSKTHEAQQKKERLESELRRFSTYKPLEMSVAAHSLALAKLRVEVAQAAYEHILAIVEEAQTKGGVEASTEMEVETDEGRVETVRGHGLVIPATDSTDGVSYLLATEGEPTERQRFALEDALYGEAVAS